MSKCVGCGIKLQNTFKDKNGYTNNLNNPYCARCFKTIHYNMDIKVNDINNYDIINKINKLGYYTIFITDLISLNNELINNYNLINNKKILIINKCDIIPDNLKLEHLELNIKRVYKIKEEIFFISSKQNLYLNRLVNLIKEYEKVIICGETGSGKSTLINKITNSNLTTSKYNNTTLDFIKIKLNNYIIYDTPGLIINKNKVNIDKIMLYTKSLKKDFILSIDDLKIMGVGNLTLLVSSDVVIKSKKDNSKLNYEYDLVNKDIVLDNGFIYVNNGKIKTNRKIEIRDSIIK